MRRRTSHAVSCILAYIVIPHSGVVVARIEETALPLYCKVKSELTERKREENHPRAFRFCCCCTSGGIPPAIATPYPHTQNVT